MQSIDQRRVAGQRAAVRIFLVRTGLCIDTGPEAHRHLTATGRQVTRAVSRRIKHELEALDVTMDAILTAPLMASVQTAELFAEGVDHLGVVESMHLLLQGVPAHVAAEKLLSRDEGVLAIVGDEPALAGLGAFLTRARTFPPHLCSQVSLIDEGRAAWTFRPDLMERRPVLLA